jgi:hypothetical protein
MISISNYDICVTECGDILIVQNLSDVTSGSVIFEPWVGEIIAKAILAAKEHPPYFLRK